MQVLYEDVDIYPDISVNACVHDMYAEGHSDELLLRLNDTRRLWDIWNPQEGDSIAVQKNSATTGGMFITSIKPENGLIALRASSMPPSAKTANSKSWEQVRFLQLGEEIAQRNGLGFAQYDVEDRHYTSVAQVNEPDFVFLQKRCVLEGAAFLVFDGRLVVYDEAAREAQAPAKTITVTPANTFEYKDDSGKCYSLATVTNGEFTGQWESGLDTGNVLRKTLPVQMSGTAEADQFARGLLRQANKYGVTGILWAQALHSDVAAASVVGISTYGADSWDGPVFVHRVRHDYVHGTSKLFFREPLEGT